MKIALLDLPPRTRPTRSGTTNRRVAGLLMPRASQAFSFCLRSEGFAPAAADTQGRGAIGGYRTAGVLIDPESRCGGAAVQEHR